MRITDPDVVIVGSGAGGGVAAYVLARAGLRVVVLEKGPWLEPSVHSSDDIRYGYRDYISQDLLTDPRTFRQRGDEAAQVTRALALSQCVGGGTVHYGAASFRFTPDMFRLRTLYGVPSGTSLADWPITYDELEPHYAAIERLVGIAGLAPGHPKPSGYPGERYQPGPNPLAAQMGLHYSRPYPLPPVAQRYDGIVFTRAAERLGLHPYPTPSAINTVEGFDGRHACVNCGFCDGWACPIGAKSSTDVTVIRRAVDTGRCEVRPEATVLRVEVDSRRRASGVVYLDGESREQHQRASVVILACSAVETARLALLSAQPGHPDGLGNGETGLVGRNLTTHHNPQAIVVITDGTHRWDTARGAWSTAALDDLQDLASERDLPGDITVPRGGVVLASGNTITAAAGYGGPISLALTMMKPPGFHAGTANGYLPTGSWGKGFLQAMVSAYGTQAFLNGFAEDMPQELNRVDLDPTVSDLAGQPVARITYSAHPNDLAVGAYMAARLVPLGEAMLREIGATGTVFATPSSAAIAARFVVHQHGTMRMGFSPQDSVVDRFGRMWSVPNLYVADGSVFPTGGGYNPTHTIEAVAHWIATHIVRRGRRGGGGRHVTPRQERRRPERRRSA